MNQGDSYLTFAPLDEETGLEVVDRIERQRCELRTPESVSPTRINPDRIGFPVTEAVQITATELTLPRVVFVYARDESKSMVAEVEHLDSVSLPEGRYTLELLTQMKTYLQVDGPVEITADLAQTRIEFQESTDIAIGARSRHERPASTITTTADPEDVMETVEAFGSALKTADPERSYPTLRGHPPAVELGESHDIPSKIQRPETGIQLELPPTLSKIYVAAPLAFYLGAELVPSSTPKLTTNTGFEYTFNRNGFELDVAQTLKQIFFLDCVTRTEGYYELPLHERQTVEPHLDFDLEALYDKPLGEQVATYLEVPYDLLEDHIPEWRLTTHVEPAPETIEQLPFVVNDLAVIRTESPQKQATLTAENEPTQEYTRNEIITRSTAETAATTERSFVQPGPSNALEKAWIGSSIPIGASKLTVEAFENRLNRKKTDGDIAITVVVNDERMDEEHDLINEVYGNRQNLPFDVSVHRDLSVSELRSLLGERTGFLHYIGHTEQDGIECTDGKLDLRKLEATGVDSFLLNSCNSYQQGLALIEAGAIGGIVTLNEIINKDAVHMGETIARLLNTGFPLRGALTVARDESILGGQYIVVGDGGMSVTQAASRTPNLLDIEKQGDEYEMRYRTFATDEAGLGSVISPHIERIDEYHISSGDVGAFTLSKEELEQFLELEQVPVRIEGDLFWSQSLNVEKEL